MDSVSRILGRHGGLFLESRGDSVLAWFEEHRGRGSHHQRALAAALEMRENAARFAPGFEQETGFPFAIGIGLNSGPVAMGIIRAGSRLGAAQMGDTVNLASRIEGLTKEHRLSPLASEETLEPVGERFEAELVGEVKVKGRERPVRLYHVIALKEPPAKGR
jgi:adenylate cyclase